MYISYKWLQKYLPNLYNFSAPEIAEALTVSIAEVEEFIHVRKGLNNIVVGEIIEAEKHTDSDKLTVCQVSIDDTNDLHTIVCGAPNVAEGQKVAVCLPGGKVLNPKVEDTYFDIAEIEIRGVISKGMICSPKEIGLSQEHSEIIVLENELPKGTDLVEILNDVIFEIENKSISHRSDLFSHMGIARELAAILKIEFIEQFVEEHPIISAAKPVEYEIDIKVNEELCKRFTTIALTDVQVKSSPIWLQSLLSAVGTRPINNVVDITNYIMMDKGQPLHAYDLDKIEDNKLIVRHAKEGEQVNTLDQKTYTLTKEMIVIADNKTVEDVAGVMGGAKSEITKETTTILFEAATWEMYNIRRTSRTLGLRSEAGTRFEKGLDANLTLTSLINAVSLLTDITTVEVASEINDNYRQQSSGKTVVFDISLVSRFLGIELSKQQIIDLLKSLQFSVVEEEEGDGANTNLVAQNQITIKVPSFRKDINIKQDIAEEIARLYGYPNIVPDLPDRDLTPTKINTDLRTIRKIQDTLISLGFDELMTYSFVGEKMYSLCNLNIKDCLEIVNPLSPELSHMRNTLLPSLLEKMSENISNFDTFSFFEIGRAIQLSLDKEGIHNQPKKIAGLLTDVSLDKNQSYFRLKGSIEDLFETLNLHITYDKLASNNPVFHPNKSASIKLEGIEIGNIGVLHPKVALNWEINQEASLFELDFDLIQAHYSEHKSYVVLSHYQFVTRDLSFWFDKKTNYVEVINTIDSLNEQLIKNVSLIDVYEPKDQDKKSIAISITLQSDSKTLEEEEINTIIDKITSTLEQTLKAELRK